MISSEYLLGVKRGINNRHEREEKREVAVFTSSAYSFDSFSLEKIILIRAIL